MIDETVAEIRDLRTHSSSVVAVKATRALAELCEREFATAEEFEASLEQNARVLRGANPSHASLHTAMQAVQRRVREADSDTVAAARDALSEAIDAVVEEIETAKHRAATHGAELLSDGDVILTHDYSTTVLEAIEIATGQGRSLDVYVTEARPRYLGRRTARHLAAVDGVDATLIIDSAGGHVLQSCDRMLVGMSCVVGDSLYNRVGTFQLAAAANELDVPVAALGSSAKVVERGFAFENEFRPAAEVLPEPAEGFGIENPMYDATPLSLVETVLTDEGPLGEG